MLENERLIVVTGDLCDCLTKLHTRGVLEVTLPDNALFTHEGTPERSAPAYVLSGEDSTPTHTITSIFQVTFLILFSTYVGTSGLLKKLHKM